MFALDVASIESFSFAFGKQERWMKSRPDLRWKQGAPQEIVWMLEAIPLPIDKWADFFRMHTVRPFELVNIIPSRVLR